MSTRSDYRQVDFSLVRFLAQNMHHLQLNRRHRRAEYIWFRCQLTLEAKLDVSLMLLCAEAHDAAYADKQNHTPRDRIELSTFRLTVGRYSQLSQQGRQ